MAGEAGEESFDGMIERAVIRVEHLRVEQRVDGVVDEFGGDRGYSARCDELIDGPHLFGVEQNGVRSAMAQSFSNTEKHELCAFVDVLQGGAAFLWVGEPARRNIAKTYMRVRSMSKKMK